MDCWTDLDPGSVVSTPNLFSLNKKTHSKGSHDAFQCSFDTSHFLVWLA